MLLLLLLLPLLLLLLLLPLPLLRLLRLLVVVAVGGSTRQAPGLLTEASHARALRSKSSSSSPPLPPPLPHAPANANAALATDCVSVIRSAVVAVVVVPFTSVVALLARAQPCCHAPTNSASAPCCGSGGNQFQQHGTLWVG